MNTNFYIKKMISTKLVFVFVVLLNYYVNSTLVLNNPKASLHLFTQIKSMKITHLTSYQIQRNKPIKMIIHGFRGSGLTSGYKTIIENYVSKDYNVIIVDYPQINNFVETYKSLPDLADYLAHFIKWLNLVNLIHPENIHIIGYSLGAQIAGMTGHRVNKLLNKKIGRITGLEPTRIGFESVLISDANKLDQSDAQFVDVVHTDPTASLWQDAGHVDFYPNFGDVFQPGCEATNPIDIMPEIPADDGWESPVTIDNLCSHKLSKLFFTEAILSDNFVATKCDSWLNFETNVCDGNQKIVFGENADKTARGKFFFRTQAEWPYYITL